MTNSNKSISSKASFSSLFSSSLPATRKSMEEVWEDISLPSLHEHIFTDTTTPSTPVPLQDHLAPPTTKGKVAPATLLSLNVGSNFSYPQRHSCHDTDSAANLTNTFDLGSSSVFHSLCHKRASGDDDDRGDWRHKRMMKNRESAARSRARKQAYTTELELKLSLLKEENARLKRQREKFLAAPTQLVEKHTLFRTLTAPF